LKRLALLLLVCVSLGASTLDSKRVEIQTRIETASKNLAVLDQQIANLTSERTRIANNLVALQGALQVLDELKSEEKPTK
jgi:prefoldin subunit 5